MKTCRVCSETKPETDFYAHRRQCKACQKAYIMGWQRENPERMKTIRSKAVYKRRALREADETVVWERLLERDGGACRKCGTTERLTIDHVVPVIRGGLHTYSNCQVLCLPCNQGKKDRPV